MSKGSSQRGGRRVRRSGPSTRLLCLVVSGAVATVAAGQITITSMGEVELPALTSDQFLNDVSIGGLSGVTWLGGASYAAVMDNSDLVIFFDLVIDLDGTIQPLGVVEALRLSEFGDHEAIVQLDSGRLLIADELTMTLAEFDAQSGVRTSFATLPSVYQTRRPNLGCESLALMDDVVWTANEEALSVDGPASADGTATIVRLHAKDLAQAIDLGQWAYVVEPPHGISVPPTLSAGNGLAELLALPGGGLLAVERSLALSNSLFLTRVFSVEVDAATDVSALGSLQGQQFTPAAKTLVYEGSHNNLEGVCLGPELDSGRVMLGVVDNGDPISSNAVVVFRIDGLDENGACIGDLADSTGFGPPDGAVGFGDFFAMSFLVGSCPGMTPGCPGDLADASGFGPPDGAVDFGDFFALSFLVGPCL